MPHPELAIGFPHHRLAQQTLTLTGDEMPTKAVSHNNGSLTREKLIALLNEDLAREFQAIIAYVNYSQVLKGAAYMNIAAELEVHAGEELSHAIILSNQIDYLGGMPTTVPKPVKTSEKAEEMLRFDLDNENTTIRNYRRRIKQCDELGEYATAEHIREILMQEQDHQIALATALGIDVPDVGIAD
jgi:bacterioferritin